MESTPSPATERRRRVWLEAAAALGAAVTLDVLLGGLGAPTALALPLGLAATLVVALRGGFVPALAVAVLWVAADLTRTPDVRDLAERIIDALTVLALSTVGLAVERLIARVDHLEHVTAALRHPAPEIEAPTDPPRMRTDPLPRLLYRYARLLNVTDEAALYTGLVITLQEALPADAVAIFTLHDGRLHHAAGDALRAPELPTFAPGQRITALGGADDRDAALLRAGVGGPPAALIVVLGAGHPDRRTRALALLEVFVDWASAVVAHARTLRALPSDSRAESAQRAEARGRAAARQFARTGRLTLVPHAGSGDPDARTRRDTVRESPAISFGFDSADPAEPAARADLEATERSDPGEVDDLLDAGLLDSGLLEEVSSDSGDSAPGRRPFEGPPSLLIGAAKASMQLEALEEQRDRRRRRSAPLPGFGGETLIDPAPAMPGADPEPEATPAPIPEADARAAAHARPTDAPFEPHATPLQKRAPTPIPHKAAAPPTREADEIAPDVRRAIERMARRLASPQPAPLADRASDGLIAVDAAELEGYAMPALDEEMVAADDLPLIGRGAFGVGVAHEVGRSVAERRFAAVLANLSDHLDPDA